MFIIYGVYKWGKKSIGYKKDFCGRCKSVTVWHRIRFFPVIHIIFIPLIPLGIFKTWTCSTCRQNPRGTSIVFAYILGVFAILLIFHSLLMFYSGIVDSDSDILSVGVVLLCISIVVIALMIYTIRSAKRYNRLRKGMLEGHESLLNSPCLYCNGQIKISGRQYPSCVNCGAILYEKTADSVPPDDEGNILRQCLHKEDT
jgi:hypothetical protein